MSKLFKNLIVILVLLITTSVPVMAQAPVKVEPRVLSVKETITFYSELNNTNGLEISKVIFCESSNNPKAIGDGGRAFGVAQFHKPTFDNFSKLMGEKLDYYSYNDQIKLMSWVWKHYPQYKSHWSCSRIVGIV